MSLDHNSWTQRALKRPLPTVCFAVSGVALVAALVGLLVNWFLAEVMAASGMLALSLFYLSLGILFWFDRRATVDLDAPSSSDFKPTLHRPDASRRRASAPAPATSWGDNGMEGLRDSESAVAVAEEGDRE